MRQFGWVSYDAPCLVLWVVKAIKVGAHSGLKKVCYIGTYTILFKMFLLACGYFFLLILHNIHYSYPFSNMDTGFGDRSGKHTGNWWQFQPAPVLATKVVNLYTLMVFFQPICILPVMAGLKAVLKHHFVYSRQKLVWWFMSGVYITVSVLFKSHSCLWKFYTCQQVDFVKPRGLWMWHVHATC